MTKPKEEARNGTMPTPQRVAIIGGGVSGLACAWHLHTQSGSKVDVHLFESESRLGGHAHTLTLNTKTHACKDYTQTIDESGTENDRKKEEHEVDIDVGFMVYNPVNYPNMTNWFESLEVKGEETDMVNTWIGLMLYPMQYRSIFFILTTSTFCIICPIFSPSPSAYPRAKPQLLV